LVGNSRDLPSCFWQRIGGGGGLKKGRGNNKHASLEGTKAPLGILKAPGEGGNRGAQSWRAKLPKALQTSFGTGGGEKQHYGLYDRKHDKKLGRGAFARGERNLETPRKKCRGENPEKSA